LKAAQWLGWRMLTSHREVRWIRQINMFSINIERNIYLIYIYMYLIYIYISAICKQHCKMTLQKEHHSSMYATTLCKKCDHWLKDKSHLKNLQFEQTPIHTICSL
jgi:hypothetical protein